MIKAVIFDWGTVLIENPAPKIVAYCSNVLGVGTEQFTAAQNMHLVEFQKGKISEKVFWEKVAQTLQVPPPTQESLWGDAFRAGYIERKEMFDFIKSLKEKGYVVGFLSNTEEAPRKYFYEIGYDKIFDKPVFSCDEGVVKPELDIYRITLERLNVEPSSAVFIDDKKENTDAAQKLGMNTVIYSTSEQTFEDLKTVGL